MSNELYISNFPMIAIISGQHPAPNGAMLISINEPKAKECFVKLESEFSSIHRFHFFDVDTNKNRDFPAITKSQSREISNLLCQAKKEGINVMVHCHAGIARSGAVVEAGLLLGFEVPKDHQYGRIPNKYVFNSIRKDLGFLHSFEKEEDLEL